MSEAASEGHSWRRFTGPYQVMVILLVGSYLGMPFIQESLFGGLAVLALLCVAMLLGITGAGGKRWNMRVAFVIVGLTVLAAGGELLGVGVGERQHVLPDGSTVTKEFDYLAAALRVLSALLILLGLKASLGHTLKHGRVDTDRIFAAIGALFLLALFWGYLYTFLDETLMPDEELFSGIPDAAASLRVSARQVELFYFSFITVTTVGYGDIAPIHPVSRSLASLEGLTGQLYLTVLVARLVALHILHSREEKVV